MTNDEVVEILIGSGFLLGCGLHFGFVIFGMGSSLLRDFFRQHETERGD